MMNIVLILPLLCVVKATVFSVNAYQDDNSIESGVDESELRTSRSCAPFECNQFCRRMGYPRGVCIGTYCQCRMRSIHISTPSIEEAVEGNVPSDEVQHSNSIETQDESYQGLNLLRDCNLQWCDQNCRRIGFPGGVCVNGRCKCDILRSGYPQILESDPDMNEVMKSELLRDCNLRWCEQSCRRNGFPGGACVGGRCKCDLLRSALQSDSAPFPERDQKSIEDCNLRWCEQNCRRIGFPGGVCVNGRCKCDVLRFVLPDDTKTGNTGYQDEIETEHSIDKENNNVIDY